MTKKITYSIIVLLLIIVGKGPVLAQTGYQINDLDPKTQRKTENVQIVEAGNIDLQVNDNFFAIAPNVWWPIDQLECFGFLADVQNNSNSTATGVNLNVTIVDNESGQTVYTDDLNYNIIPANTLVDNIPFQDCFTPPSVFTDYTGTYTITSDSMDNNFSNNTQMFYFDVTENIFSKEIGVTSTIKPLFSINENRSWAWGCYYYIVQGCPTLATAINFGIGNAEEVASRLLTISLYKWAEDINDIGNMNPDERVKVGHNVYEVLGTETASDLIELPIYDFVMSTTDPVELENETAYVLMVEYTTFDSIELEMSASTQFDYRAQVYLSTLSDSPRYAALLGKENPLESQTYESVGFGNEIMPVVRLKTTTIIDNVENVLEEENLIHLSPNPAREELNISIKLLELSNKSRISIHDINGRVLLQKEYDNTADISVGIDLTHFAKGTYFMHFESEAGVRTERFVKI